LLFSFAYIEKYYITYYNWKLFLIHRPNKLLVDINESFRFLLCLQEEKASRVCPIFCQSRQTHTHTRQKWNWKFVNSCSLFPLVL
jgi:hypothetical protein